MRKKNHIQILVLCIAVLFWSCKKKAGEGGTSTIIGSVWVEDWNAAFTVKNGEYAATDKEVYIIYGDDLSYGNRIRTNHKGEYEFKYLRKGKYQVYVYSKDKSLKSLSGDTAFVREVSITKNKTTVSVERIVIYD